VAENIKPLQLKDAISERYLSYAMSTITARALPDVRDGLKPVHRRILYTMRQLHLDPAKGFKKSARVVGDVMGKYHPHGDASIYDAMVRLAQSFSVRYPLVEGQGNFGNIDGDSAAAMRYTEAKMTPAAMGILAGLDDDAVDFIANYSGEDSEPVVMPGAFPNLLANGTNGIAVGMATNIPPHNILEVLDATAAQIANPAITVSELVNHVRAPDFPTGGIIANTREEIEEIYASGRGSFTVFARWEREDLAYSNYQIIITEIPYQVQKSRLIERIAELMGEGKLPLVGDVRDESAEDIRVVIEPKNRTVEADAVMAQLYANTELATRFALNMNVLDSKGVPRVMNLREVIAEYIAHQVEVVRRRASFALGNIERRLEILGGLLIAYLNIDKVIKIIRDNDEPKPILMAKFGLTEIQAESILNMRLRQLRKLEEMEIRAEEAKLSKERSRLQNLLKSDRAKLKQVGDEVSSMRSLFAKDKALSERRTEMDESFAEMASVPSEALVPREPITVVISQMGWIKALKTHVDVAGPFAFKEGDSLAYAFHAFTNDKIIFMTDKGQSFAIDAHKLPTGRGHGDVIRILVNIDASSDLVRVLVAGDEDVLVVSNAGYGFVVAASDLVATTKLGKQIMNLADGDKFADAVVVPQGANMLAIIGTNRRLLAYPLSEIPKMTRGKGVILQKYKERGVHYSDAVAFAKREGISFANGAKNYVVQDISMWLGKRADVGHMPPNGFSKSNKFVA